MKLKHKLNTIKKGFIPKPDVVLPTFLVKVTRNSVAIDFITKRCCLNLLQFAIHNKCVHYTVVAVIITKLNQFRYVTTEVVHHPLQPEGAHSISLTPLTGFKPLARKTEKHTSLSISSLILNELWRLTSPVLLYLWFHLGRDVCQESIID